MLNESILARVAGEGHGINAPKAIERFPSPAPNAGACRRMGAQEAADTLPASAPNDGLDLDKGASKVRGVMSTPSPVDDDGHPLSAAKAIQMVPVTSQVAADGPVPTADTVSQILPSAAHDDGAGEIHHAVASTCRSLASSPIDAAAIPQFADLALGKVLASSLTSAEAGLGRGVTKTTSLLPVSAAVDQLAELQVRRKFWISVVTKQTNAVKALVRRGLGWRYDEENGEREKVNTRAARIVAAAMGGKEQKPEDVAVYAALAADLELVRLSVQHGIAGRKVAEDEMKKIVRKLPVYEWARGVKGFGDLGLAVLIAEAGDLAAYPKKGHLWKRLGLAPYNGHAMSTWRRLGGLTADEWTEAGYSPRRRAEVYAVISEPLFRQQTVVGGPYRDIYDRRRSLTAETHPEWTKAQSHMDGLRLMTKRLVHDLWREWKALSS